MSNRRRKDQISLLLTTNAYHCIDERGEKGPLPPSLISVSLTTVFLITLFFGMEQAFRSLFDAYGRDIHPLLETETNQYIISRHIGESVICTVVSILGWRNRHIMSEITNAYLGSGSIDKKIDKRVYTYYPASQQVIVLFTAFQIKNIYDTIKFNDGPQFIFHHVASLCVSVGAILTQTLSCYGLFFMGISEISTAFVCLLACFDDHHGIVGFSQAFPRTRIIIAVVFIGLFLIFRIVMWPIFIYHIFGDSWKALKRNSIRETCGVKASLMMILVFGSGVTILQFVWLGEIISSVLKEFML